ncbi:MAG TPA: pyridoxamine 5'-phosphate oxidase family protein [Pyrinomonadaceae bacterium]|jgi:general stress protein 26|nr:pyridoxamine 5'-phosphate oxidase family protein [Pyrinomonadaceae bacterium]
MTTHEKHEENVRKLRELIKDIEVAMLTTVQDDGSLHSRPMLTQKVEFSGDLYFFTKLSAFKVEEVERDHQVSVSYAAPEDQLYVSMSGPARILRDRVKMEELWCGDLEPWFPAGLEDPELALLWISVTQAEYWEGPFGTLVYLPRVKKMAAGMELERDENEKLELRGEA